MGKTEELSLSNGPTM